MVYGLASKKTRFVLYAFLAHFVLNFPLVFIQGMAGGMYIAMAYIAVLALVALYWITRISPALFSNMPFDKIQEARDR